MNDYLINTISIIFQKVSYPFYFITLNLINLTLHLLLCLIIYFQMDLLYKQNENFIILLKKNVGIQFSLFLNDNLE